MAKHKLYKDVAARVLAAVRELNAALVEAHEHPQVRVHMRYPKHEMVPTQYGCEVTRVTGHAIAAEGDEIKSWRVGKTFVWTDNSLKDKPGKKSKAAKKAKKSPARKAA